MLLTDIEDITYKLVKKLASNWNQEKQNIHNYIMKQDYLNY